MAEHVQPLKHMTALRAIGFFNLTDECERALLAHRYDAIDLVMLHRTYHADRIAAAFPCLAELGCALPTMDAGALHALAPRWHKLTLGTGRGGQLDIRAGSLVAQSLMPFTQLRCFVIRDRMHRYLLNDAELEGCLRAMPHLRELHIESLPNLSTGAFLHLDDLDLLFTPELVLMV